MNGDKKLRKRISDTNHVNFGYDEAELTGDEKKAAEYYAGMDEADNTFAYSFDESDKVHLAESEADRLSCWKQCVHGLRSLWATRLTEDTQSDRDLYIRTTLRELILYIIFLITLMIIAFGPINNKSYLLTNTMENTFMTSTVTDGGLSLSSVNSMDDFWQVLKGPVMDALYNNHWYNNVPMRDDTRLSIGYDNLLIGVARLRQVRMASNSCMIPMDFRSDIKECYGQYDITKEDKSSFGLQNGTAWQYTSPDDLDMSSFWGKAGLYGGGGYYEDLSANRTVAEEQIQVLFDNLWLDRGTRAIFLHFSSYNPNLNLFCVAEILVESPGSGGLITASEFRSIKLIRYVTTFDYFVLACECIFLLFSLYYIVEEIMEISKHRLSYFTSVWNWLDIIIIALSLVCASFNIYRTIKVNELLDSLLQNPDQFANFQLLSIWQVNFNYGVAVTTFLAWMKIFKYISFNKTMTQLSSTLGNCAKDLAGFAVMFFIVFFSFAELGYLAFGTQVDDFSEFMTSVYTLFRIILGDFDFASLERANTVFGPIYFIVYVFFVFFVLINMFIAIINETYVGVKSDLQTQENDFEVKDFFKARMKKMLDRLKKKKNRIEKLQQAMELANTNKGGRMDILELREHLNSQGFTAEEIDSVFGRFNSDQDNTLSSMEQLKMQAKLEEEKVIAIHMVITEMLCQLVTSPLVVITLISIP
ncbi:Polycystic kidney disease protein 2 [Fasciola gigantica]|uniref:Polycystic kidney disease protein 2 n=1 Tax=Fasciola gigantica TaxID=46835 RepID=A0A504YD00_FASGI|nr:Polycystic kidney disease protein 2 [Fasciola gigantica]